MRKTATTDSDLVTAARAGDHDAFSTLAGRHYDAARGRARAILGDSPEAEDVVQEALLRSFLSLRTLERPERFRAWLNTIVYTSAMMSLRKSRAALDAGADPDSLDADMAEAARSTTPEAAAASAEAASHVHGAIKRLPSKYRVPLALYHLRGLSYRELAARLDLKLGTAQSLISRARHQLRALLDPDLSGLST